MKMATARFRGDMLRPIQIAGIVDSVRGKPIAASSSAMVMFVANSSFFKP